MRWRFRGIDHREAVLIRGPSGWGEFSPFPEYPPAVTKRWLAAAVELAVGDLPSPGRTVIPVNVTVPAVDPDVARSLVLESGASTAKIKVGDAHESPQLDLRRVEAVRDALGPDGSIRIDVNGSWDVNTAVNRLESFAVYDIQYVEQPVATVEEMVTLRRLTSIPIAADEVIRQSDQPMSVVDEGAADVLVLKVQPMGGVSPVLDFARIAGLPVVISSALETSIGMYGGLLAASLLDELPYACGLGTVALSQGDPTLDPLVPIDGSIALRRPEPDPELLQRWRPDRETTGRMLSALEAAAREPM